MSGPKSYLVSVSDLNLQEIFLLQSQLQTELTIVNEMKVNDKIRGIKFDCKDFLLSKKSETDDLLSDFTIKVSGKINRSLYDDYQNKIKNKVSKLKFFLSILENEKKKFFDKQQDYDSFVGYEEFFQSAISDFNTFRSKVVQYLESYIKDEYPDTFYKAKHAIESVEISVNQSMFEIGFRNKKNDKENEVKHDIKCCEETINNIREETTKLIVNGVQNNRYKKTELINSSASSKNNISVSTEINKKTIQIKKLIENVSNPSRQKYYYEKLDKLINSHTFNDIFYYIEMYEDIKETEKISKWKEEIHKDLIKLNQIQVHEKCQSFKQNLLQKALSLTKKNKLKTQEFIDFKANLKLFNNKNEKFILDEMRKEKERSFIKSQIVQSLQNQGYEVMSDLQVIDFEEKTDFLFNIPEQNNYLNLRIKPDGSFFYNFLIPENKAKLSIDQKKRKLAEMKTTCSEFKQLIKDLSIKGLNVKISNEKPVSEKGLAEVSDGHQDIIKSNTQTIEANQIEKKNYLDG